MRRLVFFMLAGAVSPAFATINLRFDSTGPGQTVDFVYQGNAESAFGGVLNFTLDPAGANTPLQLYCADLKHFIGGGQQYGVNLTSTLSEPQYSVAGSIVSNSAGSVVTNDDATALQVAVWASVYGCNLATNSGGTFQLDAGWYAGHAGVVNTAIVMTSAGISNLSDAMHYNPVPEGSGQGQIGPVPEPTSLIAVGLGLAALAKRRRR
ncbi:MAG: PEP-CTERM sorting domain-containing protein [Armatimonadetes bacterium]|nr:PEP-CTERM sorting domain-containing protein [Armatimonadota bacterium]